MLSISSHLSISYDCMRRKKLRRREEIGEKIGNTHKTRGRERVGSNSALRFHGHNQSSRAKCPLFSGASTGPGNYSFNSLATFMSHSRYLVLWVQLYLEVERWLWLLCADSGCPLYPLAWLSKAEGPHSTPGVGRGEQGV